MRLASWMWFAACCLLSTGSLRADILNFQLDETQSSVVVTFNATGPLGDTDTGVDTSVLSGFLSADLGSFSAPFGTAQLQTMNLLVDDPLSYTLFGVVNITSTPDVPTLITLATAGAAGNVTAGNFDQLGNVLSNQGSFTVNGGGFENTVLPFDFSELAQDFLGYQISRTGDVVTLQGTFDFTWNSGAQEGFSTDVRWQGTFVANSVVPEPASLGVLAAMAASLCLRRRR